MSGRLSRALALLVLAMPVALGAGAATVYRGLLADQDSALAERHLRLVRLSRGAAALPALRRALDRAPAGGAEAAGTDPYLSGASTALAGAALQGRIGRLAETTGMRIGSVEPVTVGDDASAGRIALVVSATGPFDGVHRLLYAIESDRPLLIVEELEIINAAMGSARYDPRGAVQVSARMKVVGHRRSP